MLRAHARSTLESHISEAYASPLPALSADPSTSTFTMLNLKEFALVNSGASVSVLKDSVYRTLSCKSQASCLSVSIYRLLKVLGEVLLVLPSSMAGITFAPYFFVHNTNRSAILDRVFLLVTYYLIDHKKNTRRVSFLTPRTVNIVTLKLVVIQKQPETKIFDLLLI